MAGETSLEILIQIRDELAGLTRTQDAVDATKDSTKDLVRAMGGVESAAKAAGDEMVRAMEAGRASAEAHSIALRESLVNAFDQGKAQAEQMNAALVAELRLSRTEAADLGKTLTAAMAAGAAQTKALADDVTDLHGALSRTSESGTSVTTIFKGAFGANLATQAVSMLTSKLINLPFEAVKAAVEFKGLARNLNVTAESLQILQKLTRDTGGDIGALTASMQQQDQKLVEARDSASRAAAALRVLGLTADQVSAVPLERRYELIARAIDGATDRQAAYAAAGEILGQNNVPKLKDALRSLATDGFDKVAASAKASGEVMSEEAIARLDAASKSIERAWNILKAKVGEDMASALAFMGQAAPELSTADGMSDAERQAARLREQQTRSLVEMRTQLELIAITQQSIEENPVLDDVTKRKQMVGLYAQQAEIMARLLALREAMPLDVSSGETAEARRIEIARLKAELQAARTGRSISAGAPRSALGRLGAQLDEQQDPNNPNALTIGEGAQAGVIQWMLSIGSTGQQVAATVQNSLGGAIGSISAKLSGQDVRSWGEVWRGVLANVLAQLLQMFIQIQIMKAAIGLFGGGSGVQIGDFQELGATGPTTFNGITAAGGGTFLTRGKTTLTVGDNPGGIEMVSVRPISGVGRSSISGSAIALAGGGTVMATGSATAAAGGDTFHFGPYNFGGGVTRSEIQAMIPHIVEASKGAVLAAQQRKRGGF